MEKRHVTVCVSLFIQETELTELRAKRDIDPDILSDHSTCNFLSMRNSNSLPMDAKIAGTEYIILDDMAFFNENSDVCFYIQYFL